jgi:hypothetical protein
MDPRHLFMDERLTRGCAYCGAKPDTRDHVPSRVLLDEPYPLNLPTVDACEDCNASFSLDEQYVACLIDVVVSGSAQPAEVRREKVKRLLGENVALASRIDASREADRAGNPAWQPEVDRVRRVLLKLARGHVAHELYPNLEDPLQVSFAPLPTLNEAERAAFEDVPVQGIVGFPEIGTRAFLRTVLAVGQNQGPVAYSEAWVVVQADRYRYMVDPDGRMVRMVLSEYLACRVAWW